MLNRKAIVNRQIEINSEWIDIVNDYVIHQIDVLIDNIHWQIQGGTWGAQAPFIL